MKPVLRSLTVTRSILGLVAALTFVATSLLAQEKGATKLIQLKPLATVAEVDAVQAGDTVVMSCPKCKDSWITVVEKTGKASNPTAEKSISQHQCPGCKTTITAEGHGKAKTDKVTHVCAHCGSKEAFCCVMKKDANAASGTEEHKH